MVNRHAPYILLLVIGLALCMSSHLPAISGDDLTLSIDYAGGTPDATATFKNFNKDGVTSGEYSEDPGGTSGKTWTKDGNAIKVWDEHGVLVKTFDEAANAANTTGPIQDGPATGDEGGTWTRPGT